MGDRCECEREWLFVPICQPYDELVTCPGCTPPTAKCQLELAPDPCDPENDKQL